MEGRDFCLYCGTKIDKVYDWSPDGKPEKTYLNLDHMDPLSLGGKDSEHNTVYCCVSCNLKKGNKLFKDWIRELEPKYRKIVRCIYIEKHGRKPEAFTPSRNKIVIAIEIK